MRQFNRYTYFLSYLIFLVSAFVYILTLEPTVSWWDSGEFIISASKLEVGHPPGAPFYMLISRFFTLFASDPSKVALWVNLSSALASAATVMLLYLSIVLLSKKLSGKKQLERNYQIIILGSAITGSLAFAFTDSFWFSAVESEVYSLSMFFTALLFWAVLKWDQSEDKNPKRWLILIAYLTGLSTGVHLLSLLSIPAIALIWYFKKFQFSWQGLILTFLGSLITIFLIQGLFIPGIPWIAFQSDRFFVNQMHLPVNSGMFIFILSIAFITLFSIVYTRIKQWIILNTLTTMLLVFLIGFSTYILILIRANANPPMNQNQPDNAFSLMRYLNREQYGNRPLLYGPYYSAPAISTSGEKNQYNLVNGKYVKTGTLPARVKYPNELKTFFPRMYSSEPGHVDFYREWGQVSGKTVNVNTSEGLKILGKPTFIENLRFFFSYQLGYMYMRYFMWNFAGRQNDIQGNGGFLNGNWISGIEMLDKFSVGNSKYLPEYMKNNPSRNAYYFLPLLFGLAGLFYHYNQSKKGKEGFWVVLTLFFMTGISIIIYLNQTPLQPRERDYAYVGSFYAFSIWIGFSVQAFWSFFQYKHRKKTLALAISIVSIAVIPGILLSKNFDDHDRSGRYMARDYAINYLESCAPNAILFTYGDNDTFPLWYVQEVEGVRRDIKIINLSYFNMDWYISQQQKTSWNAGPIPFSYTKEQYYTGIRDALPVIDRLGKPIELGLAVKFAGSDDKDTKVQYGNNELNYLPATNFYLTIDKDQVIKSKTVKPADKELIADTLHFSVNKNYILKNELAILNLIASNNWERPVYFDHSTIFSETVFFTDWLQLEGLAYRFVPIKTKQQGFKTGRIDSEILFENVMNKFKWGNVNNPGIFLDDYNKKEVKIIKVHELFTRLAEALMKEGKNEKALVVLNRLYELFPDKSFPLDSDSYPSVELFYQLNEIQIADIYLQQMAKNSTDLIKYYKSQPENLKILVQSETVDEIKYLQKLLELAQKHNRLNITSQLESILNQLQNSSGT